jgi:hypothetical protein
VQLGIFDRNEGRVVSWGSGSVISAHGHILTAAHVLREKTNQSCASVIERHRRKYTEVLVGVFEGEGCPTRWAYTCRICSEEDALELEAAADRSSVDLAVLHIKTKIGEARPAIFDGSLDSLEIIQETEINPSALSMRYLRTSTADLEGDRNVRIFGYPKQTGNIRLTQENATASVQESGWVKVNATKVATSGFSGGPLNGKRGSDQALKSGTANLS